MSSSHRVAVGGVEADRPLRADAVRNRLKIVEAARVAFTAADDQVPLEDIARDAGVGIATLYRNFPTRESLVEAVYAAELGKVTSSAETLLDRFPPDVALRMWLDGYADFVRTKLGMLETLRASRASGRSTTPGARERVTAEISRILAVGVRDGVFRATVEPEDVTRLLLGVFLSMTKNDTAGQMERLFDLILDVLKSRS